MQISFDWVYVGMMYPDHMVFINNYESEKTKAIKEVIEPIEDEL